MSIYYGDEEEFGPPTRRATMPVGDLKPRRSVVIRSSRPHPASPPPFVRWATFQRQSEMNKDGANTAPPQPSYLVPRRPTNDRLRFHTEHEDATESDTNVNDLHHAADYRPGPVRYVEARSRPRSYYHSTARDSSPPNGYYSDDDDLDIHVHRNVHANRYQSSDEDDDESYYNYTPSYMSASGVTAQKRESSIGSATPLLTLPEASGSKVKMMHVYESQYTGDACPEGPHTSNLKLLYEPKQLQHTLFRWGHLEQPTMSFSDFSDEVLKIPSLTTSEKTGLAKLLRDVKRRSCKTKKTAAGTHQYITPGTMVRALESDDLTKSLTSPIRSVRWINISFFHLKKYSSEIQHPTSAPAVTLMQANFSQHPRARDMQQVVQAQGAPADHCFHISQLWAIVVNDWFFGRFRFESAERGSHRNLLSADDWPGIVQLARSSSSKVVVEAVLKSLPSAPVTGVLTPVSIEKPPEEAQVNATTPNDPTAAAVSTPDQSTFMNFTVPSQESDAFSVFTWLIPDRGVSRTTAAQVELEHLDKFLRQYTRNKDKQSYIECTEATQDELLQAWIYVILATIQSALDYDTHRSHINYASSLLVDGMRSIMKTFSPSPLLEWSTLLPIDVLSQISLKLIDDVTEEHLDMATVYSDYIQNLQINIFREIQGHAKSGYQYNPRERSHYPSAAQPSYLVPERTVMSTRAVEPQSYLLPERAVRSHLDHERTHTRLRTQVDTRDRIDPYGQPDIYDNGAYPNIESPRDQDQGQGTRLSSTDPGGFRELLAEQCENVIRQRLDDFMHFKIQAVGLGLENQYKTQTKKDTQEQAIYAFTIVTIIFLPLSTVAGIFGMNTTDIRDIEYGQWLYWATAIPVTAFVILGGLWWMGELGNATLWLLNLRRPSGNSGRFARRNGSLEDEALIWNPPRMNPFDPTTRRW
ncbi:mg2+ transporter [Colletotrichum kahawae]|uniref:Mg2+ transporter n=1 Tax=Colletotrichum kahawae TaxID=34407 RepID=A0AAE0D7L8_COLKA|nr:mg2+ transporter [Colletotrichum kahawae]